MDAIRDSDVLGFLASSSCNKPGFTAVYSAYVTRTMIVLEMSTKH